jgi:hypothetical protein
MSSTFTATDADGCEQMMGRWSKLLCGTFLDFAGVGADERILDVGCGTGSLEHVALSRIGQLNSLRVTSDGNPDASTSILTGTGSPRKLPDYRSDIWNIDRTRAAGTHLYGFSRFSSTTAAVYSMMVLGQKSYTQSTFV